ncbi:hypothetical protein K1Y72_04710 [Actinomadura sp. PM05-2]|uniref:Mce-associated membrane protein n=1 Tax=Actinomadura parmotrematis TaxID=2864039 RepID=A0ABS7FQ20_9ACTN|nr:hypothetical protein [Actinomadura parmotrematis]
MLPAALALLLACTGAVLRAAAPDGAPPAPPNRAVLDGPATAEVAGDVGTALGRVLSYTPATVAETRRAASEVLTGAAAAQYGRLYATVAAQAPAQRVTLTTRVVRTGVISLAGGTARLLVFLDQTSARGRGRPTTAAAQLAVTAVRRDGRWLISAIQAR